MCLLIHPALVIKIYEPAILTCTQLEVARRKAKTENKLQKRVVREKRKNKKIEIKKYIGVGKSRFTVVCMETYAGYNY